MKRRAFLGALGLGIVAGPAIVRAASIMPVRAVVVDDSLARLLEWEIHNSLQRAARLEWEYTRFIYRPSLGDVVIDESQLVEVSL